MGLLLAHAEKKCEALRGQVVEEQRQGNKLRCEAESAVGLLHGQVGGWCFVYVCVCIIYIYLSIYICIYIYTCVCVCIYIYIYIHTHTHKHIYTNMRARTGV